MIQIGKLESLSRRYKGEKKPQYAVVLSHALAIFIPRLQAVAQISAEILGIILTKIVLNVNDLVRFPYILS